MKNKFIKILSLVLTVLVLLLSVLPVVFAAASPAITLSSDKKDNKLILSIYYENVSGMTGTRFELLFDKALLKPVSVNHKAANGDNIWDTALTAEAYIEAYNLKSDKVLYTGAFLNDISDITKSTSSVHYLDIVFEIAEGKSAEVNGSEVTLSAIVHFPGQKIPVELEYTIDPATDPSLPEKRFAGDVNNDGKVTAADARTILRYSVSLENISEEDIAYANIDFDDRISASDARLTLRTSVALEQTHSHYYEENSGKFVCLYCKKDFILKINHVHNFLYPDCFSLGACECGYKSNNIRGHVYSPSSPKCSVCGLDVINLKEKAEAVSEILGKINKYGENGTKAYANGDLYTFIEATLYITVYYEDIIAICEDSAELKAACDEFIRAQKIMDEAIDSIVDSANDMYVTSVNAEKMHSARNEAVKNEKQAVDYLEEIMAKHKL